ncbi:unnamed protein product, partial [Meganyctiphanes norvegica]
MSTRGNWRGRGEWGGRGWKKRGGGSYRSRGGNNWRGRGRGTGRGESPLGSQSSQGVGYHGQTMSQQQITSMLPKVPTPYKGWHLYMNEGYSDGSESSLLVRTFEEYIRKIRPSMHRSEIEKKRSFTVDLKVILEDIIVKEKIPGLAEMLNSSPQRVIDCLGLAAHQVLEAFQNEIEIIIFQLLRNSFTSQRETLLGKKCLKVTLRLIDDRVANLSMLCKIQTLTIKFYGKPIYVYTSRTRLRAVYKPICHYHMRSCAYVHANPPTQAFRFFLSALCSRFCYRLQTSTPDK